MERNGILKHTSKKYVYRIVWHNKKEAKKGIFNGIIGAVSISILLLVVVLWFLPQLLNVFGCTENIRQFALDYGFVIAIGLPFMMVGTTLNSIIRADGSPKYAMTSMVIGAILNVILDHSHYDF